MNKRAFHCMEDEREKGKIEDLEAYRTRNNVLQQQVRDLEKVS